MATSGATERRQNFHLTEDEKRHYDEQGFVVVRGVITPEHVEQLKKRSREIILGDHPTDMERRRIVRDVKVAKGKVKVDDPEKGVWKLFDPDKFDPFFAQYPRTKELGDVCESILGPDLKSFLLMVIYKPPGFEEAVHHYHQDAMYFPFGPHDLVMGTWVALDKTTAENGTMRVIPGSHKEDIKPHKKPEGETNAGIFGVEGYDDSPDEVVVELEPGDGLFFHSRLLHKTGPNVTDGHRRAITVHCCSAKCTWTGKKPSTHFEMIPMRGQSYEGCV